MDNRITTRVNFITEALIEVNDVSYKAEVENLSLTGALIKIHEKLDIVENQMIDVVLLISGLATDTKINLSCTITRSEGLSIGVKFDIIDIDAFIFLKNVVTYNTGESEKVMSEFIEFTKKRNL